MEKILSKEELEKFANLKGEVRGLAIKSDAEFVLKEKGKEGLKKIEDAMAELGYPMKYRELKAMDFYPIALLYVEVLVIGKLFNFDKEKYKELGVFAAKAPMVLRVFMRHLVSFDVIVKRAPKMWKTYYTVGEIEVPDYDKEKKYAVLRIKDYRPPVQQCYILEGYLPTLVKLVVRSPVSCEEVKCVHRGDEYHEFLLKW
jgi:hypothetical protein